MAAKWSAAILISTAVVWLAAQEKPGGELFRPAVEKIDRDCPVCNWKGTAPVKRFEGLFKRGDKCPICGGAARLVETIDWKEGRYEALGVGTGADANAAVAKLKARRSARDGSLVGVMALATRMSKALGLAKVPDFSLELKGLIKEAKTELVREGVGADGGTRWALVRTRVPLWGARSVTAALYDRMLNGFMKARGVEAAASAPPRVERETVVIIDARALKRAVRLSLFPEVKTRAGRSVYDISKVYKEYALKHGAVRYVILADNALDFDELKKRIEREDSDGDGDGGSRLVPPGPGRAVPCGAGDGGPPAADDGDGKKNDGDGDRKRKKRKRRRLIVKVDRAGAGEVTPEEEKKGAPVEVSEEDARKMEEADKKDGALKKGNVIIIVDRIAGQEGRLPTLGETLCAMLRRGGDGGDDSR